MTLPCVIRVKLSLKVEERLSLLAYSHYVAVYQYFRSEDLLNTALFESPTSTTNVELEN